MNYSARKFTALLLALIMVLSVAPLDALASVFTTYEANVVIDTSDPVQISETITASRIDTANVVVTSPDAILPVEGDVLFSELPVAEKKMLMKARAVVPTQTNTRTVGRYDITIIDKETQKEWQPEPGDLVDVRVTLSEPKDLNPGETLTLVHETDNQNVPATFYVNAEGQLSGFAFEATGFSVYAVIATGEDARLNVKFSSNNTEIASIMVKKADTTDADMYSTVLYDPGVGDLPEGTIFLGWTDDPNYKLDTVQKLSIDQVRTKVAEKLNEGVTDGDIVTYYAVLSRLYRIDYLDENDVSVGGDVISYRADLENPEMDYQVNMSYTPADNEHAFMGWKVHSGGVNIKNHEEGKIYENETTIQITGDVTFSVNAPAGHWLVFEENGHGATFNAAQFVKSGDVTQRPRPDDQMVRLGYSFGGWYLGAPGQTGDDPTGAEFVFGQELTDNTTVYAKWISNANAPYTVIFWLENASRTGYDVKESVNVAEGTVGQTIQYTFKDNIDEDYVTFRGSDYHYKGFCLIEEDVDQEVTIKPEGDSVLNLHFKRIEYDLKFYIYRKGTGSNSYQMANNSNRGNNVWNIVTWHTATNLAGMPTTTYGELQSEEVDGYTGYYFVLHAYYGEDISGKWPKYEQLTGPSNNRQPVSFVMMNGTVLKPNQSNGGDSTIKGEVGIMNENILGATNKKDGNFLILRFNTYNTWTYHLYYEAPNGMAPAGAQTKTLNGKVYCWDHDVESRSTNTDPAQQNPPTYLGYQIVMNNANPPRPVYTDGGGGNGHYEVTFYYNREDYPISFFDGVYVDGSDGIGNTLYIHDSELFLETPHLGYGANVPDEYKEYVPPVSHEEGFIFEGWYVDKGCTEPYVFPDTMPVGGITAYAKWRQIQYRVFLHPNAGTDPTLNWGSENQQMNFRVSYNGTVSAPTGLRTGYEFGGWYTNSEFNGVYNAGNYRLNEQTVSTTYNKNSHMTSPMDKWGNGATSNDDVNRPWITKEFNLYAKWSKVLSGADGIGLIYDLNGGTGHAEDTNLYKDKAQAVAQPAVTAPDEQVFAYWVMQQWNGSAYVDVANSKIYPGQPFSVLAENARAELVTDDNGNPVYVTNNNGDYLDKNGDVIKKVDEEGNPIPDEQWQALRVQKQTYTVQLRAEYKPLEGPQETHIYWFRNDGSEAFRKDEPVLVNQAVAIAGALTRTGYEFIGWAKDTQTGDTAPTTSSASPYLYYVDGAFHVNSTGGTVVTQVAADERTPYENMYAVWVPKLQVKITGNTDSKTYNDSEQSVTGYTVEYKVGDGAWTSTAPEGVSVALASGKTAEAKGTNVDTYPMGLDKTFFTVTPGSYIFKADEDLTVIDGELEITPASVTLTANSGTEVYDGTEKTVTGYTSSVAGLTFEGVSASGKGTDAGEYPVTFTGVTVNETKDSTGNYIVTETVNGTLTITPAGVTLTANSGTEVYDGTEQTVTGYTSSVEGLTFEGVSASGSGTNAGEYPATFTGVTVNETKDSTGNYIVTEVVNGTLTINPRPVTITAQDKEFTYTGEAQSWPKYDVDGLVGTDAIEATVTGSITFPSESPVDNVVESYTFTTGTPGNYTVTTANGELTMTNASVAITIKAADDSKTYDGSALTNATVTVKEGTLLTGDELVATATGSATDVADTAEGNNPIAAGYKIMHGDEDVTANYAITTEAGTLTINPRPVTITAQDKEFTYTGEAQSWPKYDVDGLVGTDAIEATVTGSITFPSESPVDNVVESYTFTTGTPGNYTVTTANGELTMTNASVAITIKAADDSKTYDGSALTNATVTVKEGTLLTGDELVATATGSATDVADTAEGNNPIAAGYKIMHGDEDVTANYAITTEAGTLTINPKAVTITAQDKAFAYTGEAQSWPKYDVDGLVGTDAIEATVTGSITFPSESPVDNVVESYTFTTGTPGNYTVTTANGELTMTNASVAITIKAADDSKTYDGSALTNATVTVKEGTLLTGDELVATATGSATDVADTAEGNNPIAAGYKIMHGDEDVTANYAITTEAGTLTINPRPVTITAQDKEFTYTGEAQSWPKYDVDGLVGTDAIEATVTGSITFPSESPVDNVVESYTFTTGTPGNYTVTTANGELTMTNASVAITIKAADDSKTYDGSALTNATVTVKEGTLLTGDELVATATGSATDVADTAEGNNPIAAGYKIIHGDEDVTANYAITTEAGTLTINPRPVTITAQDKEFTYTGEAQSWPKYDVDGLVGTDAIEATVTGSITFPSESPVDNVVESYTFTTGTPGNYTVTTANGELTMTNASVAITIKAADDSKTYDGSALTNATVTVKEGTLLTGDELVATATGSATDVADTAEGNNPIAAGYKIMHGDEDVTANYAITTEAGTLTINPRPVTITAQDKEFTYTGEAQSWPKYDVDGLVGTDAIEATVTGSITFPSESPVTNKLASYEFTSGTPDNYTVTTANGELTMTNASVAITIKAADDSKTYDGSALTNATVTVKEGTLLTGDELVATATGSATDVADTAEGNNPIAAGYKIMHGDEDVTANYAITTEAGTLTINPRPVTITAQDKEFTYTGEAQSWPKYDVDGLVGTDAIEATVTGSITFPSESPVTNKLASYEFTSGTPDNYTVTTANGELTMTNASVAITIKAADDSKTYDGSALTNATVTVKEGTLLTGDELVATATGSATDVADTAEGNNPIAAGYKIMHGDEDVTANYAITTEAGTLTINPKAVTITAQDKAFTYTGEAQSWPKYDVDGLVGTDAIEATVTGSITFPSESPVTNKLASYEFTSGTPDNYTVTTANGELTMTNASVAITITAASQSWMYDGAAHENTTVTLTEGELLEGDELVATATGSVTDVADTATGNNPIAEGYKIMHGDENVTANYAITTVAGTLTITKRTVTLTSETASKTYDGTPLTKPNVAVTGDGFVEGEVTDIKATGSVTTVAEGEVTNTITYTEGTNFKADNYAITKNEGKLKINPITDKVTVMVTENGDTVTYDGQEHTIKGYKTMTANNDLYDVETSVKETETDDWTVTKTDAGTYDMGILATDFENTNKNFTNVEFKVVDGKLIINPISDKVTVTVTENSDEVTYDGQAHTIKGYKTMVADNDLYDVATSVKETETDDWTVTKTDAGTYDMGIVPGDFENTNKNFTNVEFVIVDGQLIINPISDKVTVTVTENSDEVTYDGQAHTIKGYKTMAADNDLYDVTTSVKATETNDWTVTKTDAGTYDMGIVPGDFENTNKNFTNVEFKVVDGKLIINPISDKVTVTVTENSDEVTYDGQAHTIKGYKTMVADNDLYDVATSVKETETDDWTVTKTDAGTYDMGIVPGDFENTNNNFTNVEFKIVDGQLIINPISDKVTVTITENSGSEKYDGTEKTVTGYEVTSISNTLYTEADFEFKGDATVKGTDAGSYPMELKPADFTNISTNFTNVEFVIKDGTLEISKRTVIMTSATDTKVYDSTPLTNDEVKETGDGFVDGEGADYDVTGTQTLVGESENTFEYTLKDGTKASNYDITKVLGKLTVTDEGVPDDLVVKKTADETLYKLGDEVTFDIWVKNIYDDTVTIKLIEIEGVTLAKDTFEGVEPGEEITTTATYTITEADILAGSFTNTVTAKVVEKEWSAKADVKVEEPNASLKVTKKTTSTPADGKAYVLDETITYEITVENDGNLTLTDVTVIDEKTGDKWTVPSLAPGATETFTTDYVVTEADILAGSVKNDVTATGNPPDDDIPDPEDDDEVEDPTEEPKASLKVTKETTSTPADGKAYVLDEKITYKITVKNDGNLTLTDVVVKDELTGDEWMIDTMKPGDSKEYEAEYTVTEADVLAGSVKNDVTVTGNPPDDDIPDPEDDDEVEDPTEDPNGHITIEKVTTSKSANPKGYVEGETITYKITVKNDGNLTITDITVTDALTGDEWKIDSMAPGAEKEYETSYTVTAEDVQAGEVLNVATGTGKSPDPKNPDVPVTPGEDPEPTTEDKYTLTIEYIYQDGRTAAATHTEVLHAGDAYDVQSPYIAGYYASQQKVTGTMPARDVMVTVIYLEPRNTITIDDFVTPLGIGLGSMNAGETIE